MLLSQIYGKQYVYPLKGCRRVSSFYSGAPQRGMAGERQSRQKIAMLKGDDCCGKEDFFYQSVEEKARGLRGTM